VVSAGIVYFNICTSDYMLVFNILWTQTVGLPNRHLIHTL